MLLQTEDNPMNEQVEKLKAEIAELEEQRGWGTLTAEQEASLSHLRVFLHEAELDAEREGIPLTINRIDQMESEKRCIENAISTLACEIAEFRGDPIREGYSFDTYERYSADGWAIKEWPVGTRIISASFTRWYSGDCDTHTVRFPETYLEEDWKPSEQAMLDAKKAKAEQDLRERSASREAAERAELARLQAKYGDQK